MQNNDFSVTASAFQRIKELCKDGQACGMRVAVDGGGCSGFKYRYELLAADVALTEDLCIVNKEGALRVVIDPTSLEFVRGSTLDYIEELGGAYFTVRNPNATMKCGCGSSFGV